MLKKVRNWFQYFKEILILKIFWKFLKNILKFFEKYLDDFLQKYLDNVWKKLAQLKKNIWLIFDNCTIFDQIYLLNFWPKIFAQFLTKNILHNFWPKIFCKIFAKNIYTVFDKNI